MKKSIKLFATLMVCMAMALCVSCKKDDDKSDGGGGGNTGGGGSQTAEMRISKVSGNVVYYDEGSTDGGQTWNVINEGSYQYNEIYTWNDNLLSNIKMYSDDADFGYNNHNNYDFRYDNNKLSNVIRTHSYDDYNGNVSIDTITSDVEYDGDNMSEVTVHDINHGYDNVYHLEYSNGKLSSVTGSRVINYSWNGDNLSKGSRISGNYSDDMSFLSYDDKKNPYYGIDALLVVMDIGDRPDLINTLSKNNCTKCENVSGNDEQPTTTTVDYTYNSENYPTQAIVNVINPLGYDPQYELTRERVIETVTYEYLD